MRGDGPRPAPCPARLPDHGVGAGLLQAPEPGGFAVGDLAGLPEPVQRYLRTAIVPGTALAQTARLRMRGHIKVGRWLPFHAEQTLSPHRGFTWRARVAGVIAGSDRYVDGVGAMRWSLLGLPLLRAAGADVTRSAAGRLAGETIWLPTALLPRTGTRWTAQGPDQITVTHHLRATSTEVTYRLDAAGHITALVFDRWGDPDSTGTGPPLLRRRPQRPPHPPRTHRPHHRTSRMARRHHPMGHRRVLPLPGHEPRPGRRGGPLHRVIELHGPSSLQDTGARG